MKWFLKYLLVVPVKNIKKDKKEYDILCENIKKAKSETGCLKCRITGYSETKPYCIKKIPVYVENENEPEYSVFYRKFENCYHFSQFLPCDKPDCQSYESNHKYFAQQDDLNSLIRQKKNFWKNKVKSLQK